jgi:hypothetical protein
MTQSALMGPFEIHHANDIFAMVFPKEEHWFHERDRHFRHVATVAAPLAGIFSLTNNTDEHAQAWMFLPEVTWFDASMPIRSTSIGDVISCQQTRRAWIVMPGELKELSAGQEGYPFQI